MDFFQQKFEVFDVKPTILFEVFGVPVSSSMMTALLLTIVFFFVAVFLIYPRLKQSGIPGGLQIILEMLYSYLYDLVEKITGNPKVAKQIIPIILAIVFYVGLSNVFLTIPVIGNILYDGKSLFTTSTRDLNGTLGIALASVFWTHYLSIRKVNVFNHIMKFIKINSVVNGFKKGIGEGLMSIVDLFIGLLDIVSEVAKSLSLSLRLFGNIFAGEILLSLILSVFAIIVPVPLLFYGIFAGLLQALVFGSLVSSYFGNALND